jgi:hypothetical protein
MDPNIEALAAAGFRFASNQHLISAQSPPSPLSSRPQWRDLQFPQLFFPHHDRRKLYLIACGPRCFSRYCISAGSLPKITQVTYHACRAFRANFPSPQTAHMLKGVACARWRPLDRALLSDADFRLSSGFPKCGEMANQAEHHFPGGSVGHQWLHFGR